MVKCDNTKISLFSDSIECWKGLHLLYSFLSFVFSLVFYIFILILILFFFNPLNNKSQSTRISTSSDIFFTIFKILNVIRFIFISSDWLSIVTLVLISLMNLKRGFENPTYQNYLLESLISIRNSSLLWTYLVLLISKFLYSSNFNNQIYLLLLGFPLIIIFSLTYYIRKSHNFLISNNNFNDESEILLKIKYLKILVESFLSKNKNSKSGKSNSLNRDEIFLKGFVIIHEETCVSEDCPLKKFLSNPNDYNIQKMSLLHYMNILFNEGIKKFPNSKIFIMNFVQFNYEKKYNLNSAKALLAKLEKTENNLTEDFLIYCIKQNFSNTNKINKNTSGDEELLRLEDTPEHKFKRCNLKKN